jgi:hypothetical protein
VLGFAGIAPGGSGAVVDVTATTVDVPLYRPVLPLSLLTVALIAGIPL